VHLTASPVDWYAARAAGIVAYILLTLVVCVGLGLAGRERLPGWPRFAVEDVHRFGGLMVGAFLTLHIATVAIDSFLPFSIQQLVVPFTATYRPIWVALGIVAAELLLALAIANHYRRRMPYRWWRATHYLNFVVWTAATLHGLGSGTDRGAWWMQAMYVISVASVLMLLARRAGRPKLVPVAAAVGFVPVLLAAGPLALASHPWNAASFHDHLTGQILQEGGGDGGEIVSMSGSATGSQPVLVRADLLLVPTSGEQTAFRLEYLPSGTVCAGTVTATRGTGFDATCRMPDGSQRQVSADWNLAGGSSSLSGTIVSRAAGDESGG
jgi:methionine sulfoxide reductase heme-binding subunit